LIKTFTEVAVQLQWDWVLDEIINLDYFSLSGLVFAYHVMATNMMKEGP
jgi:hypothetical protein